MEPASLPLQPDQGGFIDQQSLSAPDNFKEYIENIEKEVLYKTLSDNQFHQRRTAESLGLSYHQLRGYLKKYHLTEKKG